MSEPVVHEEVVSESPFISMVPREFVRTILSGVAIGIATGLVYVLLNKFVFGTVLCRPQSTGNCAQAPDYAAIVAAVVSVIAGVAVLARARIYRPLLIVLAVIISLWGLQNTMVTWPWYWGVIALAVLFGIAYGLYTWLARIRNFILAIVITLVVVVLVRWVLVA